MLSDDSDRVQRGDLLLLSNPQSEPLRTGDITVYNVGAPGSGQIPIVHRVIETHDVYVPPRNAAQRFHRR